MTHIINTPSEDNSVRYQKEIAELKKALIEVRDECSYQYRLYEDKISELSDESSYPHTLYEHAETEIERLKDEAISHYIVCTCNCRHTKGMLEVSQPATNTTHHFIPMKENIG